MNHNIYIDSSLTDSREISRYIYIYIYINQAVTFWFKGFLWFIKGEFQWIFEVLNRLFVSHDFSSQAARKRRSSFHSDIFWLGKNNCDEVGLLN